jgi:hypothetical protein
MGVALGDFDRNGRQDLFVTNFYHEPANLFLQSPSGVFVDQIHSCGLYQATWETLGFGAQALDLNNDGRLDLVSLNGHIDDFEFKGVPFAMTPQVFLGKGTGFSQLRNFPVAGEYWKRPAWGRALALCDWNLDGQLDLVATHIGSPAALLINESATSGKWLELELVGTSSERDGIGAAITLHEGDQQWHAIRAAGNGYLACNEPFVHFGLGAVDSVSMAIRWPSGKESLFFGIQTNHRYLVVEDASSADELTQLRRY